MKNEFELMLDVLWGCDLVYRIFYLYSTFILHLSISNYCITILHMPLNIHVTIELHSLFAFIISVVIIESRIVSMIQYVH